MTPFQAMRLASGVSLSALYVTLGKTSNQTGMSNSTVTWETVVTGDPALANLTGETVAIPDAGYTLGRARGLVHSTTTGLVEILRDGTATYSAKGASVALPNDGVMPLFSGLQTLVPGSTTFSMRATSGAIDALAENWFGVELYPNNHRYSLATKTVDSGTVPVDTTTNVTFDSNLADAEGMHSTSSNTHLFQVPSVAGNASYEVGSGNAYVRLRTQLRVASSGGSGELWCMSRYAATSGGALNPVVGGFWHQTQGSNTDHYTRGATAILTVPGGAVLAVAMLSGSGATAVVKGTQNTWGELELLPNTTKFVLIQGAVDQTVNGGNWRKALATTITNNCGATLPGDGSVVTPAGFKECRVSFNVVTSGIAVYAYAQINNAYSAGMPQASSNGAFGDSQNGEGNWVPISPAGGETIDLRFITNTTVTMSGGSEVWMCVEFR